VSWEHSPARAQKTATAAFADQTLTIDQFCAAENISRSMLYRAWQEGWGPRYYLNGISRRITASARREWQAQREAAAAEAADGSAVAEASNAEGDR
jgi:hypothetical protein